MPLLFLVSVFRKNHKKAIPLIRNYLGMIVSNTEKSTVEEKFQWLFLAMKYMNTTWGKFSWKIFVRSNNKSV